jgi:signal transduction histidine kinase
VDKLSWLDGYEVHQIPSPHHANPFVHESRSGRLWSPLINNDDVVVGLQYFDEMQGKWVPIEVPEVAEWRIGSYELQAGYIPGPPEVFCILSPTEVAGFDADAKHWQILKRASETQLNRFVTMCSSKDGGVWIRGERGLAKYQPANAKQGTLSQWTEVLFPNDLQGRKFYGLGESQDGSIVHFFGRRGQESTMAIGFDGESFGTVNLPSGDIVAAVAGQGREILTLVSRPDRFRFTVYRVQEDGRASEVAALEESLYTMQTGPSGDIWTGSLYHLARYTPPLWATPREVADLNLPVHSIIEDTKGRLWFASFSALVLKDDETWRRFHYPEGIHTARFDAQSLSLLADGRIVIRWMQYPQPIVVFNPDNEEFEKIPHPEARIFIRTAPRKDGTAWLQTGDSSSGWRIEIFDGMKFTPFLDQSRAEWNIGELRYIAETQDGHVWFGGMSEAGLALFDGTEYRLADPEGERFTDGALSILEVNRGCIWVGTRNKIFEFKNNQWREVRSGLDQVPAMIRGSDGSVWVATWSGLHRCRDGSWNTNTTEDGLPSTQVLNVFEDSRGRVWAGTSRGLSLYHPEADPDPPRTILPPEENLTETPPGGEVRIVFSGVDKWKYTDADRLLYSYRLDSDNWSEFSEKTVAVFSGLQAGPHRFQVRAMDRNWNKDPQPPVWEFQVLLPWYKQPGFLITTTIGALLTLLLAGIAMSRHFQLERSNAQLQRANDELRELDKMKSAFVSQASHDLRTPLTAIKSSLDNLVRGVGGGLNERQKHVMDRAVRAVDRLTHLINDVLDINRIEAGRIVLDVSEVALDELVQRVVHENEPAADQKKITLRTAGLNQPQPVLVDVGKMERVVGEIIGNAIKYTPEGGTIEVRLRRKDNRVVLSVRDSGIGMTPEECKKIFERFYRTLASQKMSKGSGLGLSIAKELVDMHGGTVTVESEAGKGTIFTVTLAPANTKEPGDARRNDFGR